METYEARTIPCSHCNEQIEADSKFCSFCGKTVIIEERSAVNLCEKCGSELKGEGKFCGSCGNPISSTANMSTRIMDVHDALYRNHDDINLWIELGDYFVESDNHMDASMCYDRALDLCDTQKVTTERRNQIFDTKFKNAYEENQKRGLSEARQRGYELHNNQLGEELLIYIKPFLNRYPNHPALNLLMGMAYADQCDDEISDAVFSEYIRKSIQHYEIAYKNSPIEPVTALLLAGAYFQNMQDEEGYSMLEEAKTLMKKDAILELSSEHQENLNGLLNIIVESLDDLENPNSDELGNQNADELRNGNSGKHSSDYNSEHGSESSSNYNTGDSFGKSDEETQETVNETSDTITNKSFSTWPSSKKEIIKALFLPMSPKGRGFIFYIIYPLLIMLKGMFLLLIPTGIVYAFTSPSFILVSVVGLIVISPSFYSIKAFSGTIIKTDLDSPEARDRMKALMERYNSRMIDVGLYTQEYLVRVSDDNIGIKMEYLLDNNSNQIYIRVFFSKYQEYVKSDQYIESDDTAFFLVLKMMFTTFVTHGSKEANKIIAEIEQEF